MYLKIWCQGEEHWSITLPLLFWCFPNMGWDISQGRKPIAHKLWGLQSGSENGSIAARDAKATQRSTREISSTCTGAGKKKRDFRKQQGVILNFLPLKAIALWILEMADPLFLEEESQLFKKYRLVYSRKVMIILSTTTKNSPGNSTAEQKKGRRVLWYNSKFTIFSIHKAAQKELARRNSIKNHKIQSKERVLNTTMDSPR